jgi:hypothetical protein
VESAQSTSDYATRCGSVRKGEFHISSPVHSTGLSQLFVSNLLPHFATTPFQFDAAGVKTFNMAEHVRTERPEGTYRKNDRILFMLNVWELVRIPCVSLICLAS